MRKPITIEVDGGSVDVQASKPTSAIAAECGFDPIGLRGEDLVTALGTKVGRLIKDWRGMWRVWSDEGWIPLDRATTREGASLSMVSLPTKAAAISAAVRFQLGAVGK